MQVERPVAAPVKAAGRPPDRHQADHQVAPHPPALEGRRAVGRAEPDRHPGRQVQLGPRPLARAGADRTGRPAAERAVLVVAARHRRPSIAPPVVTAKAPARARRRTAPRRPTSQSDARPRSDRTASPHEGRAGASAAALSSGVRSDGAPGRVAIGPPLEVQSDIDETAGATSASAAALVPDVERTARRAMFRSDRGPRSNRPAPPGADRRHGEVVGAGRTDGARHVAVNGALRGRPMSPRFLPFRAVTPRTRADSPTRGAPVSTPQARDHVPGGTEGQAGGGGGWDAAPPPATSPGPSAAPRRGGASPALG